MKDIVIRAVGEFMNYDRGLLDVMAHEQAISHRIAVYLELIVAPQTRARSLNIDCEYNKHLTKPKTIDLNGFDHELCRKCGCRSCRNIVEGNLNQIPEKAFRPDILVHSRGNDDKNGIAIEVKKNTECPFDKAKLRALTKSINQGGDYGYQLGVFIWFPQNEPKYKWFTAGEEILEGL